MREISAGNGQADSLLEYLAPPSLFDFGHLPQSAFSENPNNDMAIMMAIWHRRNLSSLLYNAVKKICNEAPAPSTEPMDVALAMRNTYLPFLSLLGKHIKDQPGLETSPFHYLFGFIINIWTTHEQILSKHRPEPDTDWAYELDPDVFCFCSLCEPLTIFIQSESRRTYTIPWNSRHAVHIKLQIRHYINARVMSLGGRRGGSILLTKLHQPRTAKWEARVAAGKSYIKAIGKNRLKAVLGDKYDTVMALKPIHLEPLSYYFSASSTSDVSQPQSSDVGLQTSISEQERKSENTTAIAATFKRKQDLMTLNESLHNLEDTDLPIAKRAKVSPAESQQDSDERT